MEISHRIYLSQNNSLIGPYLTYGICGLGKLYLDISKKDRNSPYPSFSNRIAFPFLAYFFRDCSYLLQDINRQTAPVSILNQFVKTSQIHNQKTISVSSDSFYVKFSGTDNVYTFFTRIGSQIWNSIPYSIKIRLFVKR